MEIKGLEDYLNDKADLLEGVTQNMSGKDLNILVKSIILTLKETKDSRYLEFKNKYINDVIKATENEKLKNETAEELRKLKSMYELELEIAQIRLDTLNEKMEALK